MAHVKMDANCLVGDWLVRYYGEMHFMVSTMRTGIQDRCRELHNATFTKKRRSLFFFFWLVVRRKGDSCGDNGYEG